MSIETTRLWETMREAAVRSGLAPEKVLELERAVVDTKNVFAMDHAERGEWVLYTGAEAPVKEKADIVYFAGCVTSYSGRLQNIAASISAIMNHVGEDWTVLGQDESCCGHPLRLNGVTDNVKEIVENNVEAIEAREPRRLVTGCPGCYLAFRDEYPEVLGRELSFEVVHFTELLHEYLRLGKIAPSKLRIKATYHDPCELGRLAGIVEEPRYVLRRTVSRFIEAPENGVNGRCCGAGGGLKGHNLALSEALADTRYEMLTNTGAQIIVSACPACHQNLSEAAMRRETPLNIVDLAELMAQQLGLV